MFGFDFLADHCLSCGMTFGLDLSPNTRNRGVEAIADRNFIVSLLEVSGDSELSFQVELSQHSGQRDSHGRGKVCMPGR